MSNIVKAIRAVNTDSKINRPEPLVEIAFDAINSNRTLSIELSIKATVGSTINIEIDENSTIQSKRISEATRAVKMAVIEELFGEFRPFFKELSIASYNEDRHGLRDSLDRFYQKMYTEI